MCKTLRHHNHLDTFFYHIEQEIQRGSGFVPILGAGISADSGVPLIRELEAYLAQCILRVLGLYHSDGRTYHRLWNPRRDRWPVVQELTQSTYRNAFSRLREAVQKWREGEKKHPHRQFALEALGALADWRSSLLFLSRVVLNEEKNRIEYLGAPNSDVIDVFFRTVTSGKRPSLTHHMLAQLANPMRFDLLLSTNFDELLEEAFSDVAQSLDVIEIHLNAGLPEPSHLDANTTLIKLHGGRYGLRADYSLDLDPTREEIDTFASYFYPRSSDAAGRNAFILGVSGDELRLVKSLQGAIRTNDKGVQDHQMKVFWLCHNSQQEESVHNAFSEQQSLGNPFVVKRAIELAEQGEADCNFDILTLQHSFTGLLLLQLYQQLSYSIPPRKALFPSASQLSIPPVYLTPEQLKDYSNEVELDSHGTSHAFVKAVERIFENNPDGPRVLRITEEQDDTSQAVTHGVVSLASHHFYRAVQKGARCVWLSLENIGSTDELFEQLTDAFARAVGITDWMPIVLHEQSEKAVEEIRRLTQGRGKWVVFLDARDAAGNTRNPHMSEEQLPNGWLDDVTYSEEGRSERNPRTANAIDFWQLITSIVGNRCPNVNVVFLYHQYQKNGEAAPLHRYLSGCESKSEHIPLKKNQAFREAICCEQEETDPTYEYCHEDAAKRALSWIEDDHNAGNQQQRKFFLLGLICANRMRYPALLLANAFHSYSMLGSDDAYQQDDELLENRHRSIFGCSTSPKLARRDAKVPWLAGLSTRPHPVIRLAPGGFVWMHADVKQALRFALGVTVDACSDKADEKAPLFWGDGVDNLRVDSILGVPQRFACFRTHYSLAQWYDRLFCSSGDPLAGIESITHFLEAAFNGTTILLSRADYRKIYDEWGKEAGIQNDFAVNPELQVIASLSAVRELLSQVRNASLASGYPKASCRSLVWLRVEKLDPLRRALQKVLPVPQAALELLDAIIVQTIDNTLQIAREVSENTRAFHRNRQIQEYLVYHELDVNTEPPANSRELNQLLAEQNSRHGLRRSKQSSSMDRQELTNYAMHRRISAEICLYSRAYLVCISVLLDSLFITAKSVSNTFRQALKGKACPLQIALLSDAYLRNCKTFNSKPDQLHTVVLSLFSRFTSDQLLISTKDHNSREFPYHLDGKSIQNSLEAWAVYQRLPTILNELLGSTIKELASSNLSTVTGKQFDAFQKTLLILVRWCIVHIESLRYPIGRSDDNQTQSCGISQHIKQICKVAEQVYLLFVRSSRSGYKLNRATLRNLELRRNMEAQMSTIYAQQQQWKRAGDCLEAAVELHQPLHPHDAILGEGVIGLHQAQLSLLRARDWALCGNGTSFSAKPSTVRNSLLRLLKNVTYKEESNIRYNWPAEVYDSLQFPSVFRKCVGKCMFDFRSSITSGQLESNLRKYNMRWPEQYSYEELIKDERNRLYCQLESLNTPLGYLEDASKALKSAERVLVKKRKNVWWSTWLFQLQAKVVEYRLLLCVAQRIISMGLECLETPELAVRDKFLSSPTTKIHGCASIPILGLEACPRGDDTFLDIAFDNTLRMVRQDLLRATRVVESYSVCVWALYVLLKIDPSLEKLPSRQDAMRNRLSPSESNSGPVFLRKCLDSRAQLAPPVDPFVEAYAKNTIELTGAVFEITKVIS